MIIIVMIMIIIMIFIIIIVIITQPLVGSLFPVAIWLADSFLSVLPCMRTGRAGTRTSPAQPLARLTRPSCHHGGGTARSTGCQSTRTVCWR